MMRQHWFRWRLGAIRHQAITCDNVDPDTCHYKVSIGHNVLIGVSMSQCWLPISTNISPGKFKRDMTSLSAMKLHQFYTNSLICNGPASGQSSGLVTNTEYSGIIPLKHWVWHRNVILTEFFSQASPKIWQLLVPPMAKISSQWWHFCFSKYAAMFDTYQAISHPSPEWLY